MVPYENLDIQLGRPVSLDPDALFDKLIRRRRGGYCYEQNAGLAMLLRLAGFEVSMVEGGVMRQARGDAMWGNHHALIIDLDGRQWVADAGIGDGFIEPLHLREGPQTQGRFTFRLERLASDTWRFHHHPGATIVSYDFRLQPREPADFAARSHDLSTSPESPYVTTLIPHGPLPGTPRCCCRGRCGSTARTAEVPGPSRTSRTSPQHSGRHFSYRSKTSDRMESADSGRRPVPRTTSGGHAPRRSTDTEQRSLASVGTSGPRRDSHEGSAPAEPGRELARSPRVRPPGAGRRQADAFAAGQLTPESGEDGRGGRRPRRVAGAGSAINICINI
ncbi:arylamine N-acetyltransferase [Streptomyces sp. NPDC091287]|uniref:arylamine N-acetyltransferase family protein n=1 Tax=Streptomyces sp. NPDC091287 TaxID=3365988 RepID=UPI003814F706